MPAKKDTPEKYFKELAHLTVTELYCYGIQVGLTKPTSQIRKEQIVRNIADKDTGFLDNPTKRFYFSDRGNELEYIPAPAGDVGNYKEKKIGANNQIDVSRLKTEFENAKKVTEPTSPTISMDDFQISGDVIIDKRIHPSPATVNMVQSTQSKDSKFHYRQKIKYEPSHGIEAFIRSVETYAAANEITDRLKFIAIAKSALNSSDDGLLLQDALLPAEEQDWDLFKNKLLSLLGHPADYYRDFYRSFRRGTQRCGLAMSRLIQAYKRGFLSSNQKLEDSDKKHIMHQFIASLDNPLRGLLKAEERTLTFDKIADRAAELERCFGGGFAPDSVASMMFPEARVQMVQQSVQEKNHDATNLKIIELLTALTTESRTQKEELSKVINKLNEPTQNADYHENRGNGDYRGNRGNGGYRGKPRNGSSNNRGWDRDLVRKLDGYCYHFVKTGNCQKSNCNFRHDSPVPTQIKQLFSQ